MLHLEQAITEDDKEHWFTFCSDFMNRTERDENMSSSL
jgi:hypothetical protein